MNRMKNSRSYAIQFPVKRRGCPARIRYKYNKFNVLWWHKIRATIFEAQIKFTQCLENASEPSAMARHHHMIQIIIVIFQIVIESRHLAANGNTCLMHRFG